MCSTNAEHYLPLPESFVHYEFVIKSASIKGQTNHCFMALFEEKLIDKVAQAVLTAKILALSLPATRVALFPESRLTHVHEGAGGAHEEGRSCVHA